MLFRSVYFLFDGRETLAGATDVPFITYLWLWPLIVFAIGMIIALVLRSTNPAKFAGIGRYMHEDIAAS